MQSGKILCLRMAQDCFTLERKSLLGGEKINARSKLIQLSPFLDHDIIIVCGRISNSELSIETKKHKISYLILNEEHVKHLHPGVSSLFAIIKHYWIIGARNLIRELTYKCLRCFRQAQHTTQQQQMAPKVRVRQVFPFQNIICDYADIFTLKFYDGRNPKTPKGYICISVCMVTSAIHLELETDLFPDIDTVNSFFNE